MRLRAALAFTLVISPAFADMPPRKAGLWEVQTKFSIDGREGARPTTVAHYCIDAATEQLMGAIRSRLDSERCRAGETHRAGYSITTEWSCKVGDMTTTSRRVVTAKSDIAYTVTTISQSEGGRLAPGQRTEMLITTEGKWIGVCAADQRPGDIITNGRTTNIRDPQPSGGLY